MKLPKKNSSWIVVMALFTLAPLSVHGSETAPAKPLPPAPKIGLANPASGHCAKAGGQLSIHKRGDGGEYGICTFEDNRQCEEWALLRGQCPVGGFKITGYTSPAQVYCAIQGGKTTTDPGAECALPDGSRCENEALFNGKCPTKP